MVCSISDVPVGCSTQIFYIRLNNLKEQGGLNKGFVLGADSIERTEALQLEISHKVLFFCQTSPYAACAKY